MTTRTFRSRACACAAALALLAAGCSSAKSSSGGSGSSGKAGSGDYKFGVMLPLTGPAAPIGETLKRGTQLAVNQINAAGGVDGMKLVPLFEDNKATAEGGAAAANKLINLEHTPYLIGTISSAILAALPLAQRKQVVMVNNGASDPALLNQPFLYSDQVMNNELIPPLVAYLRSKGLSRAAIMATQDPYGKSGQQIFQDSWTKAGGKVVQSQPYALTDTDLSAPLRLIGNADPDVVFVMATGSPFGSIVKQARAAGIKAQIAGPLATQALISVAGTDANGVIDVSRAVDPSTSDTAVQRFLADYKSAYGTYPDWTSCITSESVHILAQLIDYVQKSGGDPRSGKSLNDAFDKAGPYPASCVQGQLTFLPDHSAATPIELREVTDGAFKSLQILTPQNGAYVPRQK